MLCRPRPNSNALNRVAIGYKNPLCLTRAKLVQPALYNGHEIIKDNHIPAIVHNSKDTLKTVEITRKKMNDKMNDPECVTRKTTDSQITKLNDHVTHLQAQNDLFRAENDKIKQHYKELYDSIKITRTKHIEQAILSGADNRPPMLEKDMYDSWKSKMELYMLNRQHVRMILESVEQGPLLRPTVEEDGVTRLKKYFELSAAKAIQADCDVKATNIILQGLPPKVYALVSTHKIAKELWERIQMLMQGTSLTKQERE
nr:hypothetical protein [Tanacetum cinerariifolium]